MSGLSVSVDNRTAIGGAVPAEPNTALRPIWLCADDYGISRSVNRAIRDLITRGRLNATSVMVAAPSCDRAEAASLNALNAEVRRVAIGLHVTLTGPFQPMSSGFRPTRNGAFMSMPQMLARGSMRLLRRQRLAAEIATQLKAFVALFGRRPDFVDGHQHVHLFPQVRDALLDAVREVAPHAWVRQCGRAPLSPRPDRKGLVIDTLSRGLRSRAARSGIKTNPAFAGTYDFKEAEVDFAKLFPGFLAGLPAHSVVMCHPGFVDAELQRLDPLTTLREREYAYFSSAAFPDVLRSHGVTLAAA
jgi:chitin disaccharide deacetylase